MDSSQNWSAPAQLTKPAGSKDPYLTDHQPSTKLLSIMCHGKNDDYMGNFKWRLETALNSRAKYFKFLGAENEVELLVCDWGSDVPLYKSLELTHDAKQMVRFVMIPPELAKRVSPESAVSTSHAINVSVRRARGEYVFMCDSDILFPLDTLAKLLHHLRTGCVHEFPTDISFFWASRYNVPNDFVRQNPPLEHVEEHIDRNWTSYVHDKLSKENFMGAAAGLLCKREMAVESRSLHEALVHWGWNDIELHNRLCKRYRWEDLDRYGMKTFHLEHYAVDRKANPLAHQRKENPQIVSTDFAPNPDNWGLGDEHLVLLDGYGQVIDPKTGDSNSKSQATFNTSVPPRSVHEMVTTLPIYRNIEKEFEFDPKNWFTNAEILQQIMGDLKPKTILEVGSFLGGSARFFASFPAVEKVMCVDHWDRDRQQNYEAGYFPERLVNNTFEVFMANCIHTGLAHKIYPIRLDSNGAAAYLEKEGLKFDLIYIDGEHSSVGVKRDIKLFTPFLAPDGLMCGDDWSWQTEPNNVAGAVLLTAKERNWEVFYSSNFWFVIPKDRLPNVGS